MPEDEFEAAHAELDDALHGSGPLAERYIAWREADALDDHLTRVVGGLSADLRERTAARFGLPDGESVEWDYVTQEPLQG